MSSTQVNGDIPNATHGSVFLQHLLEFPVVNDGVDTFKSNEYGQRSIKIGDQVYKVFAAPVLPWLARPYQFVSPYVTSADSFGDKTLDRLEERFPVVKKPTADLYEETKTLVLLPYNKGIEGRDHVFDVYSNEYKKTEPKGLIAQGKAAVTTVLVVSNETLGWLSSFLTAKKAEANHVINEKVNQ